MSGKPIMRTLSEPGLLTDIPDCGARCVASFRSEVWIGGRDGSIRIANSSNGKEIASALNKDKDEFYKKGCYPNCMMVTHDKIWIGFSDGLIALFNAFEKTLISESKIHTATVNCIISSYDGSVFTGSEDWLVHHWDSEANHLNRISGIRSGVTSLLSIPKGLLCSTSDGHVYLYNIASTSSCCLSSIKAHKSSCLTLLLISNTEFWSAGGDGIHFWTIDGIDEDFSFTSIGQVPSSAPVSTLLPTSDDADTVLAMDKRGFIQLLSISSRAITSSIAPPDGNWHRNGIITGIRTEPILCNTIWTVGVDGGLKTWFSSQENNSERYRTPQRMRTSDAIPSTRDAAVFEKVICDQKQHIKLILQEADMSANSSQAMQEENEKLTEAVSILQNKLLEQEQEIMKTSDINIQLITSEKESQEELMNFKDTQENVLKDASKAHMSRTEELHKSLSNYQNKINEVNQLLEQEKNLRVTDISEMMKHEEVKLKSAQTQHDMEIADLNEIINSFKKKVEHEQMMRTVAETRLAEILNAQTGVHTPSVITAPARIPHPIQSAQISVTQTVERYREEVQRLSDAISDKREVQSQARITFLEADINRYESRVTEQDTLLDRLNAELLEKTLSLTSVEGKVRLQECEHSKLSLKVSEQQTSLASYAEAELRLSELSTSLELERDELLGNISSIRVTHQSNLDRLHASLNTEIDSALRETASLQSENDMLRQAISTLEEKMISAGTELDVRQQQILTMQLEKSELSENVTRLLMLTDVLQEEKDEHGRKMITITHQNSMLETRASECLALEETLHSLERQAASQADTISSDAEVQTRLSQELNVKDTYLESMIGKCSEMEELINALETQNIVLTEANTKAQQAIDNLTQNDTDIKVKLASALQEKDLAMLESDSLRDAFHDLEASIPARLAPPVPVSNIAIELGNVARSSSWVMGQLRSLQDTLETTSTNEELQAKTAYLVDLIKMSIS